VNAGVRPAAKRLMLGVDALDVDALDGADQIALAAFGTISA
jgi:hypothetical protein